MIRLSSCVSMVLVAALALASDHVFAGETPFADACRAAQELAKAEKFADARAAYEKALAIEGLAPDQTGQALLAIGDCYCREWKWQPAVATFEKATTLDGASSAVKVKGFLGIGKVYENYGAWDKVKAADSAALKLADIAPEQKVLAQKGLVKALMNLREFADARAVMKDLLAGGTAVSGDKSVPIAVLKEYAPTEALPATERVTLQASMAKTLYLERNFAEARAEFAKAQAMPGLTDPLKAEIQLYIGLCYYDAQDYEHAKPELLKVVNMPEGYRRAPWDGGRMAYVPAREAMLRLHLRKLVPEEQKVLKVLFIGSSHTLRGDLPDMVTKLAASAPANQPRIIAGDYVRMGTNLVTFWNAGDAPDTARGAIASEPWDAVVFETFYNMKTDEIMKYAGLFGDLIRAQKAVPVLYESPIQKAASYPERFQKYHDDNVAAVKTLKIAVAPSVRAWMRLLGPQPTQERFDYLYADWIHASPKGAYVSACCLYAALTGCTPAGLYHPADITEAEAKTLQEAAWAAYQEMNQP